MRENIQQSRANGRGRNLNLKMRMMMMMITAGTEKIFLWLEKVFLNLNQHKTKNHDLPVEQVSG